VVHAPPDNTAEVKLSDVRWLIEVGSYSERSTVGWLDLGSVAAGSGCDQVGDQQGADGNREHRRGWNNGIRRDCAGLRRVAWWMESGARPPRVDWWL
jgi:hypothetical protein